MEREPVRTGNGRAGGRGVKLLLSIITTSAACGFFAGLFVSHTPFAWAGLTVVALIAWQWIAAEMLIADMTTREEEL